MSIQDLITRYERINNFADNVSLSKVIEDLNELMESRKPVVPQFVADWIEECKNDDFHLFGAMEEMSLHQKNWIIGLEKMTIWNYSPVLG